MKYLFNLFLFLCSFFFNIIAYAYDFPTYIPDNPQKALILIHGFGQNGNGMAWLTDKLKHQLPDTAFYYPTAPDNAPYGGYQWFFLPGFGADMVDIKTYGKMLDDAYRNTEYLRQLVKDIHNQQNIPYQSINVAGFSQGGLMAILTGLSCDNKIGRVVSFSGVPLVITDDFGKYNFQHKPDILLIQGNRDTVIPSDSINMTQSTLHSLKIAPKMEIINNLGHKINTSAIDKAIQFLQ